MLIGTVVEWNLKSSTWVVWTQKIAVVKTRQHCSRSSIEIPFERMFLDLNTFLRHAALHVGIEVEPLGVFFVRNVSSQ